jgi:K+-dependent Na+/Ca+ exchanger-like protein
MGRIIRPISNSKEAKEVYSHARFLFRSGLGVMFVGAVALSLYQRSQNEYETIDTNRFTRLLKSDDDDDDDDDGGICAKLDIPGLQVIIMTMGVMYMFVALAIVCDEYFVPALEVIGERNDIADDVAGATLMAAGGSAPELFTSLIGTFNRSDVGIGTIVGSAVFNVLFVIGMCAVFSKELLKLTWWPLFRDCCWYTIALALVGSFFANGDGQTITWWEAFVLLIVYFGYVLFMAGNEDYEKFFKTKIIPFSWGLSDDVRSVKDDEEEDDERNISDVNNLGFIRPTRFRAGVLTILLQDQFEIDNLGVHLVANITGAAAEVFKRCDANGDGILEDAEIKNVLESAGLDSSPEAVKAATKAMMSESGSSEGITLKNFTAWYLRCEERIRQLVVQSFEECDTNHNGMIEFSELKTMIVKLTGKNASPKELVQSYIDMNKIGPELMQSMKSLSEDDAMNKASEALEHIAINFDEFKEWYFNSLFWTERKAELAEAAEVAEGNEFSYSNSLSEQCRYIFLYPLLFTLENTLCNPHDDGKGIYCYAVFLGSILWIAVYSYFMVTWATIIGSTLGIPDIIMGLTFLAAGTSVPDLLSSVIVARQGLGDMAVSSSIGSNIFDVTVGLPVPWLLFIAINNEDVYVDSSGVALSIFILLFMLVSTVGSIMYAKWALTKQLGYTMFCLYFVYVIQEIIRAALDGTFSASSC